MKKQQQQVGVSTPFTSRFELDIKLMFGNSLLSWTEIKEDSSRETLQNSNVMGKDHTNTMHLATGRIVCLNVEQVFFEEENIPIIIGKRSGQTFTSSKQWRVVKSPQANLQNLLLSSGVETILLLFGKHNFILLFRFEDLTNL